MMLKNILNEVTQVLQKRVTDLQIRCTVINLKVSLTLQLGTLQNPQMVLGSRYNL